MSRISMYRYIEVIKARDMSIREIINLFLSYYY